MAVMREENSRKSWVEGKESEIKMIRVTPATTASQCFILARV